MIVKAKTGEKVGPISQHEATATAEAEFARQHDSVDWRTIRPFHDSAQTPKRPTKVPDHERKQARRELADACCRFLVRSYNSALIDRATIERMMARLDIGIDEADLKR